MIVADIVKDKQKNFWILMGDQKEGQLILEVFESFVKNNPRKSNAKKMLKELEANLGTF